MRYVIFALLKVKPGYELLTGWTDSIVMCCYRTRLTNILRSFWWMLPTALLEMIQESTGSATQSINTGNCVASLLLGKAIGVYGAEDISTTKIVHPAGQPGRETTLFPFVATVDFVAVIVCCFIFQVFGVHYM